MTRSFTDQSYYNTPIPANLAVDPNSAKMIAVQATKCPPPTIKPPSGSWALPWSEVTSKAWPMVTITDGHTSVRLRIDATIGQMAGDDGAAVFRDWTTGLEVATFETIFARDSDGNVDTSKQIRCSGYAHYALDSNGLARQVAGGDPRNSGHRGIPGGIMALLPDEAVSGVFHKLKAALGQPADHPGPNFPMYGIESPRNGGIPEGANCRLKKSSARFNPNDRIHVAMATYGVIIGDTAGAGKSAIKTVQGASYPVEVLRSLDVFAWADWEVMTLGAKYPTTVSPKTRNK